MSFHTRISRSVNLSTDAYFRTTPEEFDINMSLPYMGDEIEDWDTMVPLRPAQVPHTGVFCDLAADDLFYAPSYVGAKIQKEFAAVAS